MSRLHQSAFQTAVPFTVSASFTPSPCRTPLSYRRTRRTPIVRPAAPTRCCVESSNTGANPSFDERGEALVRAAMLGETDQVYALLSPTATDSSPSVDVSYESVLSTARMTALMWAAAEGYAEIARALLDVGAGESVNVRNVNGDTALLLAMENMPNTNPFPAPPPGFPGAPNLQKRQEQEQASSQSTKQPRKGEKVITSGHVEVVNLLLEHGADVSIRTSDTQDSMLHLATRRGQDGLMRQLLARGLSLNDATNHARETPLHVAARQAHVPATTLLCNLGADVNARNVFGWTPLIWAAASGWENIVEVLLEHGADVNVKAKGGSGDEMTTALKEARKSTRPDSISRLLIRAGATE